jgi:hypothetical protein
VVKQRVPEKELDAFFLILEDINERKIGGEHGDSRIASEQSSVEKRKTNVSIDVG